MTTKELAAKLDKTQKGNEIPYLIELEAKKAGLAVMFERDDLTIIRGAIDKNVGCNVSGSIYFNTDGLLKNDGCANQACPYYKKQKLKAKKITVIQFADGYSWIYISPDIAHETFDILKEGKKYCRGMVFSMDALKRPLS
jgi:hypothetical protein